jgi:hypothetical protein
MSEADMGGFIFSITESSCLYFNTQLTRARVHRHTPRVRLFTAVEAILNKFCGHAPPQVGGSAHRADIWDLDKLWSPS